jgi:biopolymer transport protein ExbD
MKLPRRLVTMQGALNVAPLISVVLLLLIFFMLSSSFIVQPGFRVELPRSNFGQSVQADNLFVSILMQPGRTDPATGKYIAPKPLVFFNDQIIELPDLEKRLNELAKDRLPQTLVIKADKGTPYGDVVTIMNMALALKWSVVQAMQREEGPHHAVEP